MPASQQFSGTGNPNGVVIGNPGDTYQDETGKLWINTAAPSTWVQADVTVPAVIFDDAVAGTDSNIRSARAANQSPIDNTKGEITNFGSQDHLVNPAATGATANGATIGGGNDNTASSDFSTVVGGQGNTASGFTSVSGGDRTTASGTGAVALGLSTNASGDYSMAVGNGTSATANYANAEGSLTTASGQYSHAEGSQTTASGLYSHAEGSLTIAQGDYSHAEGSQTQATGLYSHAGGSVSVAAGDNSLAHGDTATANGYASAAIGESCTATGEGSTALGAQSNALRSMQVSHAAGRFTANGDAQSSWVEMRGSTPGAAPGEAVELKFGFSPPSQTLQLEDGKGYTIEVSAVAKDTVAGGKGVQSWVQRYSVRRAAGLTVIAAAGAVDQFGDAASATWTLAASVGAAPDRFVLTFTTTGAQAAARCVAKVQFVEVANP